MQVSNQCWRCLVTKLARWFLPAIDSVGRFLLVVSVHLEYHRLRLHVLNERAGNSNGDVLHVVEV